MLAVCTRGFVPLVKTTAKSFCSVDTQTASINSKFKFSLGHIGAAMTTKPSDSVSTEDNAGFVEHEEIGCSLIFICSIVNLISCIGNEFMETDALRQPSCEDNFQSTIHRNNFVSNIFAKS
jgi:hypothetical protein